MLRELGHELVPLEEVRERILGHVAALPVETVSLANAYGRVLREDLVAAESVPAFANSAMDGFAVRSDDLVEAAEGHPVTLRIAAEARAGGTGPPALRPGETIRIMTGAPLPAGADAVVPHELTRFDERTVDFSARTASGRNVRAAGGDFTPGAVALTAGITLRGPQLAIAAALGRAALEVTRGVRVATLFPGDELVEPGVPCGPGQVRNSNAYSISGALLEAGAEPAPLGIVADREDSVRAALKAAAARGCDAVVSTGGASAGDYDFIQKVVREDGRPGHVFKVAMRPGKPLVFGIVDGIPVFGLPGNPAAAILSFEVFVRPALRRLRGEAAVLDSPFGVRFPFPYRYKPGRVFLLRTRIEADDPLAGGGFRVATPGAQDSSFLASLAIANGIVFLPADRDEVRAGEVHPAIWLGGRP